MDKTENQLLSKEKILASKKKYRDSHRDFIRAGAREYNHSRPPLSKEQRKKYKDADYIRLKNNPIRKAIHYLRVSLRDSIKRGIKISSSDYISFTREEFVLYMESKFTSKMNWDNYGRFGWHVDHIRPIASFNMNDISEAKECWKLNNLQPLWWSDNLAKGSTWAK